MSTKTLRQITLPTGEVKMRTVAAPPSGSSRDLLVRVLGEYEKAIDGLELLKVQAERAKAEEEAALSSETLSDEDLTVKVIGAQRAQNVYGLREGVRMQALTELEVSVGAAREELLILVRDERFREHERCARAAMEGYGVPEGERAELFDRLLKRGDLDELEFYSKPLQEWHAMEPTPFYVNADNPEATVQFGRDLLVKWEEFEKIIAAGRIAG